MHIVLLSENRSFFKCGCGGTGRRAALRSLWDKTRGSSSLLSRTISSDSVTLLMSHTESYSRVNVIRVNGA